VVNLLPVLKFDGYFLLSDWLGQENLFERSFALGRWWLRETLFGLGDHPPEELSPTQNRFMITLAICVWVYRFFLFMGIALLVYYFFFKLLGIFLFVVEIWWFVLGPVFREVGHWWRLQSDIKLNSRSLGSGLFLIFTLYLFFIPWRSTVEVSAILTGASHAVLFAPVAGRIAEVDAKMGDIVQVGATLAVLKSSQLEFQLDQARQEAKLLKWEFETSGTSGPLSSRRLVAKEELLAVKQKLAGLKEQQQRLKIATPIAGVVTEPHEALYPGQWISKNAPLFRVVDL
jgi:putative peptide zinc metalloprotease protein